MAGKIKGITIEIDGDTTKLTKALKGTNNALKDTQSQLKNVNRLLKLDPGNTELLKQKQKLLANQISNTKDKISTLKTALSQIDDTDGTPEVKAHTAALKQEIIDANQKLKGFQAQLSKTNTAKFDQLGAKFKKVGSSIGNLGKKMTAGVTLPIVVAGAGAVKMASDFEENLNKVDVVFGNSKQSIIDWSNTATTNFGLSKNAALEATSLFGDMGTSMGIPQSEAATMSISLAGLAGDLASFKNIGIDQAMTALAGVFTGETESLKGLGIIMNQTNLEEFAAGQGLVYKEMSQAEKVALRYQYVLSQTSNAQGDYANTSDGVANATKTLKANIENIGTSLGANLLPIVQTALEVLNNLAEKFGNLSPETQKSIVSFALFIAAIGPVLAVVGPLISIIGTLITVLPTLGAIVGTVGAPFLALGSAIGGTIATMAKVGAVIGGGVLSAFGSLISGAVSLAGTIGGALLGAFKTLFALMMANPITIVIAAIAALVAGFVYLWNTSEGFRAFWIGLWESIKEMATSAGNAIVSALSSAWNTIASTTSAVWSAISSAISSAWSGITSACSSAVSAVGSAISTGWNAIKSVTESVWNAIKSVTESVWNAIKTFFQSILNQIKTIVQNGWNAIKTVAQTTTNAIKSVIEGAWNGIKTTVLGAVNGIKTTIQSAWGTVKSITISTFQAVKEGILTPINTAWDAVKKVVNKMKNAFNFEWKLPKIKVPSITISGGFSLNPPSAPSFDVSWHAKGGLFTGPSIIGNHGFGEAGPEYALPLNRTSLAPLASMLNSFDKGSGGLEQKLDVTNGLMKQLLRNQQKDIVLDSGVLVGSTINQVNRMLGGQLV